MSLTITGRISSVLPEEKGTSKAGKEWRKQAFVVDTGDQYNPYVAFSLFGDDKIRMLADFKEGEQVEVSFNLSSREYGGKWYHNIDAWRIQHAGSSSQAAGVPQATEPQHVSSPADDTFSNNDEEDDLPF